MAKRNPKRKTPPAQKDESDEDAVFDNVDFDEAEEADFDLEDEDEDSDAAARKKHSQKDDAGGGGASAEPAGKPARDFFQTIGDTLKSATQTAGKYARVGVSIAELEKLRLQLKMAHAKLGETMVQCWDDAPDIAVASTDPAVRIPYRKVKEFRRRIREIENKIRELQGGSKPDK